MQPLQHDFEDAAVSRLGGDSYSDSTPNASLEITMSLNVHAAYAAHATLVDEAKRRAIALRAEAEQAFWSAIGRALRRLFTRPGRLNRATRTPCAHGA